MKEGGRGKESQRVESKLAPSPVPYAVLYVIFGNVSRCPGLVLDERPRRYLSDKYSWHIAVTANTV